MQTNSLKNFTSPTNTICPTLIAYLYVNGQKQKFRIIIDNCSQINLISKKAADIFGLTGEDVTLQMSVSGGRQEEVKHQKKVVFRLQSVLSDVITEEIVACTVPLVCQPIEKIRTNPKDYNHLRKIYENGGFSETLPMNADSIYDVDIMVGQPFATHWVKGAPIKSNNLDEPAAINYILGHALSGSDGQNGGRISKINYTILRTVLLDEALSKFHDLEIVGITKPPEEDKLTYNEEKAENMMAALSEYDSKQKIYLTDFLWRDGPPVLDDNRKRAQACCYKIVKQYKDDPKAMEMINAAYQALLDNNFATPVKVYDINRKDCHYLSSFPVIDMQRNTKCRLCFNAKAHIKKYNKSFNDLLLPGSTAYLPNLTSTILYYRLKRIALMADLKSMFLSFHIKSPHWQRFYWSWGGNVLQSYELNRLGFGFSSSPYQAGYLLYHHSKSFSNDPEHKIASETLCKRVYVDDLCTSIGENIEEAKKLVSSMEFIFSQASLKSHKWVSNEKSILSDLKKEDILEDKFVKALGMRWNHEDDYLCFDFFGGSEKSKKDHIMDSTESKDPEENCEISSKITKRTILSLISKLFDPTGQIQFLIFYAKKIMADLWKGEYSWDTEITDQDLLTRFNKFKDQIPLLSNIIISRCLVPASYKPEMLCSFGDGSLFGICSTTYLISSKIENGEKKMYSALVFSKSRVISEKKQLTVPKIELLAALLTCRSGQFVQKSLELDVPHYYFSDSEINVYRIRSGKYEDYRSWVAGKMLEILDLTEPEMWFHCSTQDMPSDVGTKGCLVSELNFDLWFSGPQWLKLPGYEFKIPTSMNDQKLRSADKNFLKQKLPAVKLTNKTVMNDERTLVDRILKWREHLSSSVRLLAWIFRFKRNFLKKCKQTPTMERKRVKPNQKPDYKKIFKKYQNQIPRIDISTEYEDALKYLIRVAQEECFDDIENDRKDFSTLKNGQKISEKSSLAQCLPFYDPEDKIIRMDSRLNLSNLYSQVPFPIIIPKDHYLCQKMIMDCHLKHGHSNLQTTLSILRRKYWLEGSLQTVKKHLFGHCLCRKPVKIPPPRLSRLPNLRVNVERAFQNCQVDFLGPFHIFEKVIVEGKEHEIYTKAMGCLFSDYYSRALHIELIPGSTMDDFFHAYRRFVSRRGEPSNLYSDCARVFTSSAKLLKEMWSLPKNLKMSQEVRKVISRYDWEKIETYIEERGTKFHHNIPKMSWGCGIVERSVGLLKACLVNTVKNSKLNYQQMASYITEAESLCNLRPLNVISGTAGEAISVTASELAIGRNTSILPDSGKIDHSKPLSRKMFEQKRLANSFFKRWQKDYLQNLSISRIWRKDHQNILKKGMHVLIMDNDMAKNQWSQAIVVDLKESADGRIRSATLRNKKGNLIRRPLSKLAVYEHSLLEGNYNSPDSAKT